MPSDITDYIANTNDPEHDRGYYGLDRSLGSAMRYLPALAWDQQMQDYLAPLAHQRGIRNITARSPIVGAEIASKSLPYNLLKWLATQGRTGTYGPQQTNPVADTLAGLALNMVQSNKVAGGGAAMSQPSLDAVGRAWLGFGQGTGDWLMGVK